MLKKLNTYYFLKIVFSFMDERRKLKIVKYNKTLQKILDRNLTNYKLFSSKYIKYESDGQVKELTSNSDKLIYEGGYLNGKRHGKGKEYDIRGRLQFEGEYLNGKRNGKGKEYDLRGNLQFEGEYKNGERNGKGKEYFFNNHNNYEQNLVFDGEYLNGQKNGKGKEYDIFTGKLLFEGEYIKDIK